MSTISFDPDLFVARFPAFSDGVLYPTESLQMYWDTAILFVSNEDYGWLTTAARTQVLWLMTAHITQLSTQTNDGDAMGVTSSATIDKVTVSLVPPPIKDQFQWWINLTPYGAQLFALLNTLSVGGFYIGGSPNYAAFRKPNGAF